MYSVIFKKIKNKKNKSKSGRSGEQEIVVEPGPTKPGSWGSPFLDKYLSILLTM